MKRQFSSWTSGLSRRSPGVTGGRSGPWASFPSGRRSQSSLWSSGWLWLAIGVVIILIFSTVALSAIGPTSVAISEGSPDARVLDSSAPIPDYDPTLTTRPDTPLAPLIVDMIWKLGLVAALIVVTAWVLRYLRSRFGLFDQPVQSSTSFSVLDTVSIGPDQTIYTLDLGRRILVVGATGAGLSNLTEIDDPDEIRYLRRRSGSLPSEFEDILESTDQDDTVAPTTSSTEPTAPDDGSETSPFQDVAERLRVLAESPAPAAGSREADEPDNS